MRKLLFLGFFVFFINQPLYAQWIQNQALTGGSIINDIISYNNDIYIAVNDNGLYKSSDNGDSWSFVDVGYDWSIDRLEEHKGSLYAATSGHVFISDNGINWTDSQIQGNFIKCIQSDGEHLYLASLTGGVFKSEDDGLTWNDINDGTTGGGVESFAKVGDILFAGKRDNSGIIFKSVDDGQLWEQIVVANNKGIIEIDSDTAGVYLNVRDNIFFSADDGISWTDITNGLSGHTITNLVIHDNTVYVNANGSIYTTIDKGANWKGFQNHLTGFNTSTMYIDVNEIFIGMWGGGIARNNINVDQGWKVKNEGLILNDIHRIGIQSDTVFVGTEHTFVRSSYDKGKTWNQEENLYGSMGIDARYMTIYKNHVYVGSGGYGVMKRKVDGLWEPLNVGLSNALIEDLGANNEYIYAAVSDDGVFRSTDPSQGWTKKSNGISSGVRRLYNSGKYMFAGTWNGIFMSANNGDQWLDISRDLPDRSINTITLIDSTIFIATQNQGIFRSSINGSSWSNISIESVDVLKTYRNSLIKGNSKGKLAISDDLGNLWKSVDENMLPEQVITDIAFSTSSIFVGFGRPGQGIWQRKLHEVFPPLLTVDPEINADSVLREDEGIVIASDQEIKDENGDELDSVSLYSLITIYDSNQNEIPFKASIDSSNMQITIIILAPLDGEKYVVEIDSTTNESGLRSAKYTSQEYKFHKNAPPVLGKIQKIALEKQEITISADDFSQAFSDAENDPLELLNIIYAPKHGELYKGTEVVADNTTIPFEEVSHLIYIPNDEFIGQDSITWNGFDGFDFSSENSSITLRIDAITGIEDKLLSDFTIYPNPSYDQIKSFVQNDYRGTYRFTLTNINGSVLKEFEIQKDKQKLDHSISLSRLRNGLYILQIEGNGEIISHKVLKK